jgi:hypothetical protein
VTELWDSGNRGYNTFPLLWCEDCGKAEEPPRRPRLPDFVADPFLECSNCGRKLALLRCIVAGTHYQERLGAMHQHVATLGSLPDREGRWPR